jgi:uncharacterized membrane protein YeiH
MSVGFTGDRARAASVGSAGAFVTDAPPRPRPGRDVRVRPGRGLTALRATRLDIVGVVTLAMITALGGGILRDLVIGAVPPATFDDWRYLAVATAGGLVAFALAGLPDRLNLPINLLDAAGLSLFAVTGASKALDFGLGPGQAIILGAVTAVGGGTVRDVLIGRIPAVLHSGLYAIPALIGAAITVAAADSTCTGWWPRWPPRPSASSSVCSASCSASTRPAASGAARRMTGQRRARARIRSRSRSAAPFMES